MPTPEYVLSLREKIGTDLLWLTGVTAVVTRGEGADRELLVVRRADTGAYTPVTGIVDPARNPRWRPSARSSRRPTSSRSPNAWRGCRSCPR